MKTKGQKNRKIEFDCQKNAQNKLISTKSLVDLQKDTKPSNDNLPKTSKPKPLKSVSFCIECPNCAKTYRSKVWFQKHKCKPRARECGSKPSLGEVKQQQSMNQTHSALKTDDCSDQKKVQIPSKVTNVMDQNTKICFKSFRCDVCFERFEHRSAYIHHKKRSHRNERTLQSMLDDIYSEYITKVTAVQWTSFL